jgi:xanthine dehydrogenase accessory factor
VYDIALGVDACLRAQTQVDVAWVVTAEGFGSKPGPEALAITPGGGRLGSALSGAADAQLVDLAGAGTRGRLLDLHIGDADASLAGLTCGGEARFLLMAARNLPEALWARLRDREPICLVTELDGDEVVGVTLHTAETVDEAGEDAAQLFRRGVSATAVSPERVTTVLWPVPKLVVVGAGEVVDAVQTAAKMLGWDVLVSNQVAMASGLIAGLAVLDKVLVVSHDLELAGPTLSTALSSQAGYIGALGSRRTQQARADWLAYRGITDLDRIHGPAGLDIGASSPAEIAVSILAEALATASGAISMATDSGEKSMSLRDRTGAIHQVGA